APRGPVLAAARTPPTPPTPAAATGAASTASPHSRRSSDLLRLLNLDRRPRIALDRAVIRAHQRRRLRVRVQASQEPHHRLRRHPERRPPPPRGRGLRV